MIMSSGQLKDSKSFSNDGDYLITALPKIGLGVATADCLPIVIYDNFNQIIANVHAGWRGTVERVVVVAVEQMISFYGSELRNLQFFFGPSAKACCYEVKEDMMSYLEKFSYSADIIQKHDDRYTLDVPLLNRLQLEELGVKEDALHMNYNACTMCNPLFCSYRRLKNTERQMTVVVLNG
jgi:YfiH family protein